MLDLMDRWIEDFGGVCPAMSVEGVNLFCDD